MDANNKRDNKNGGNTGNRRYVNNNWNPAKAERPKNSLNFKTAGTPATEGTPTMVKKHQEQKGCQQQQDPSNSRMSKTNSMNAKLRRKVL